MGRRIQERLGLTDAQGEELSGIVRGFEARRRELFRSEQATRRRVEALLLESQADPEEARELLARAAELRLQEAELVRDEQNALLAVLTPIQVLELQAVREEIGRRIRSLSDRRSDDTGGRRRRGGAGAEEG
jgi:Spy/CpxP family protein refolding chaperone